MAMSSHKNGGIIVVGNAYNGKGGTVFVVRQQEYVGGGSWAHLENTLYGDGGNGTVESFGFHVDTTSQGDKIVVGTYSTDRVYVFELLNNEEWILANKLVGATDDSFGRSVAVASDGSRIIVGAYKNHYNGNYSGSVYIYDTPSYSFVQRIDGDGADEFFGLCVEISRAGSCVAVATSYDQVRLYKLEYSTVDDNTTAATYSLLGGSIVGTTGISFGLSISLADNCKTLAVGAIYGGVENGATFLYAIQKNAWNFIEEIAGEMVSDQSGISVALSEDGKRVAIGARYNDGGGHNSGHVRVYESTGGF